MPDLIDRPSPRLSKSNELFTELLAKMADALKYHFDPVVLKKGGYYPQGHGEIELDQQAIRKAARELLEGRQPLKVTMAQQAPLPALSDRAVTNVQVETVQTVPPRTS